MHLKWKHWRFKNEVKTAEDFVNKIANGSRMSGKNYLVKFGPHEYYPTTVIMHQELVELEQVLQSFREEAAPQAEMLAAEVLKAEENGENSRAIPAGEAEIAQVKEGDLLAEDQVKQPVREIL